VLGAAQFETSTVQGGGNQMGGKKNKIQISIGTVLQRKSGPGERDPESAGLRKKKKLKNGTKKNFPGKKDIKRGEVTKPNMAGRQTAVS